MSDYTVALISHEYPPYTIGGISSYCSDLAAALSEKQIRTIVFCGLSDKIRITKANEYLTIVRLPFFDFPPRYLWFQVENLRKIYSLLTDNSIVHCVNPISSGLFSFLKKKTKAKFITTVHEHPLAALKQYLQLTSSEWSLGDFGIYVVSYPIDTFLLRACLRVSDHVVVAGEYTRDYLLKVDGKNAFKISVIYNGINLKEIDGIKHEARKSEGSRIISYGRLVSTKGFSYLLKIMPELCRDFPELSLRIIGRGPLEGKLRSQISSLNTDKIRLEGFLPHKQLIREVKNSDLVVLPTFHEVGPFIAALEAMACCKTVVVPDLSFAREFIVNMENGIMAKAFDDNDLRNKIRLALSDRILREKIGKNARGYIEKHHSWANLVDKYIKIYEECLHR